MILRVLLTILFGLSASESWAAMCDVRTAAPTYTDLTSMNTLSCDTSGNTRVSLGTLISGEDQTNNVLKVEQQFSYAQDDADLIVTASPGFLHAIVCYGEDGTAEAGSVQIRDATTAGTGTVVWQETIAAAAYTSKSIIMDIKMLTGIVIDFTTTTDVFCLVSYR